jgi:hypothetical protein
MLNYLVNAAEAHQWRCRMLRTLYAKQTRSMDSKPSRFSARQQAACDRFTLAFLSGPTGFLLRKLQDPEALDARRRKLFDIWTFAGTLSTDLWTQLSCIHCQFLGELEPQPFSVNSLIMEAHRMYKLEDGDPRLDGKDVVMAIYPAVLAYGNVDGERYEESRVLAKANVWLCERKDFTNFLQQADTASISVST